MGVSKQRGLSPPILRAELSHANGIDCELKVVLAVLSDSLVDVVVLELVDLVGSIVLAELGVLVRRRGQHSVAESVGDLDRSQACVRM